jgi:hypothetical protein
MFTFRSSFETVILATLVTMLVLIGTRRLVSAGWNPLPLNQAVEALAP